MSSALLPMNEHAPHPELEEILMPEVSGEKEAFIVDNPEKAAWTARRIIEAEERVEQFTGLAKEYKKRIDAWFDKTVRDDRESIEHLKSLLRPFIEEEVSKQFKGKTIRYPGLSIQLRKKPDRIEITDKEIAISFCEANHEGAVIVKKDLSKTYLKDLLTKKGEIIPGTVMVPGESELYFKDEDGHDK